MREVSPTVTPQRRKLNIVWLVSALAITLLVASCGASPDAELSVVDSDQRSDETQVDEEARELPESGDDDQPAEITTIELPPPVPPESSPALRQSEQTHLAPSIDPATGEPERLPLPEEDRDDVSNPANAVPRPTVAVVPEGVEVITIPVEAGAASGAVSDEVADQFAAEPTLPAFEIPPAQSSASGPAVDPAAAEAAAVDAFAGVNGVPYQTEPAEPDLQDEAPGIDEVAPTSPDPAAGVSDPVADPVVTLRLPEDAPATAPAAIERESDCEKRPWDRGCPIPTDIFDEDPLAPVDESIQEPDADAALDGAGRGSAGDPDAGGVEVPQEVIDDLLTPPDG